ELAPAEAGVDDAGGCRARDADAIPAGLDDGDGGPLGDEDAGDRVGHLGPILLDGGVEGVDGGALQVVTEDLALAVRVGDAPEVGVGRGGDRRGAGGRRGVGGGDGRVAGVAEVGVGGVGWGGLDGLGDDVREGVGVGRLGAAVWRVDDPGDDGVG